MCKSQFITAERPTTREACAFMELLCSSTAARNAHGFAAPSIFHTPHGSVVNLALYADRLATYFSSVPSVVACIYLGRLLLVDPSLFCHNSASKLLLAAMTVAAKFCEDRCLHQRCYASCGAVATSELNDLEAEFLRLLDYRVFVSPMDFQEMNERLVAIRAHMASQPRLLHPNICKPHIQAHQSCLIQTKCPEKSEYRSPYVQTISQRRPSNRKRGTHNVMMGRTSSFQSLPIPDGPYS